MTPPTATSATTATVVFTDLVGSTALRAQLGEPSYEALRQAHDRMVREAIAAQGGMLCASAGRRSPFGARL